MNQNMFGGYINYIVHHTKLAISNGLMNLIIRLRGDHVSCDSLEDTAELSKDGKSLVINFVFCGTVRTITIGFNRTQLDDKTYIIKDVEGNVLDTLISSVPGIDQVMFSKVNLSLLYPNMSTVEIQDEDD